MLLILTVSIFFQTDISSALKVSSFISSIFLILRSFVVSGGSAVYVAAYSVFYFVTKLEIDEFVPTLLYFSYTVRFYSWIHGSDRIGAQMVPALSSADEEMRPLRDA